MSIRMMCMAIRTNVTDLFRRFPNHYRFSAFDMKDFLTGLAFIREMAGIIWGVTYTNKGWYHSLLAIPFKLKGYRCYHR
jgi:hypothetical protein